MEGKGADRKKWLVPLAVIGLVLLIFIFYQWIIPRTNLEVRTVYHESPSGGGTGGMINLNVLLTNWGNRDISDLDCLVIVFDGSGKEVARNEVQTMMLSRGENAEMKLKFIGSQYNDYQINIEISFHSSGSSSDRSLEYRTVEEPMNVVFVDNIR